MRVLAAALVLIPSLAFAQQQQQAARPADGGQVYDMVAADRETAWRINRVTGEVTVCRIDTTGSLDGAVKARCSPAAMDAAGAQQSQAPTAPAGRP